MIRRITQFSERVIRWGRTQPYPIIAIFPSVTVSFPNLKFIVFPPVPLQKFTCCPFNSRFLALSFTSVCCFPSSSASFSNFFCCFTKILLFTFHNNIVLPYYCRSTRLLFFLQYSIVSFYDCIILFSQLCHLLFTIEVLTQCSCSFPKNYIVCFHKVLFFFDKAIVHLPMFYCLLPQFYCLILLHCYYFHNTNTVLFPQFYPRGAKVYKFCRNSPRAWIDWRSRQSRISRNWCPCSSVFMYKRVKNQRKIVYPHNCMLPVTNLPKFRTTKNWLLLP